jgi:hypothetical protein
MYRVHEGPTPEKFDGTIGRRSLILQTKRSLLASPMCPKTAAGTAAAVRAIRATGARQPILILAAATVEDANLIYEVSPQFAALRTEEERSAEFDISRKHLPHISFAAGEHTCMVFTWPGWRLGSRSSACSIG